MALEGLGDLVDIGLGGVVAGLERRDFVRRLLEQAEEALVVVIHVEVLELGHYPGDKIARLAQILGAHLRERRLRERRHLLLGAGAEGEHLLGVRDVDLLGERVHLGQLFGGKRVGEAGRGGRVHLDDGGLGHLAVAYGIERERRGGNVREIGRFVVHSLSFHGHGTDESEIARGPCEPRAQERPGLGARNHCLRLHIEGAFRESLLGEHGVQH